MLEPLEQRDAPCGVYEAQLAAGFWNLRFDAVLESAFADYFRSRFYLHVRISIVSAAALILATLPIHLLMPSPADVVAGRFAALLYGVLLPVAFVCYLLVARWRAWAERHLEWISLLLIGVATGVFFDLRMVYAHAGIDYPYESFLFIVAFTCLLSGLRFRPAMFAAAVVVAVHAAGCVIAMGWTAASAIDIFNATALWVLLAGATYLVEHTLRTNFLQARISDHHVQSDWLTGLLNRRGFDAAYQRAWAQARRDVRRVSIAVIDIDRFKDYNDRFGHLAGDRCLRQVAEVIRRCTGRRPLDCCARLGGEEFVVVHFGQLAGAGVERAEYLRAAIRALEIAHPDTPAGVVTVSVGIIELYPSEWRRPESEAIAAADGALYAAKLAGRNRVRVATVDSGDTSVQPPPVISSLAASSPDSECRPGRTPA